MVVKNGLSRALTFIVGGTLGLKATIVAYFIARQESAYLLATVGALTIVCLATLYVLQDRKD